MTRSGIACHESLLHLLGAILPGTNIEPIIEHLLFGKSPAGEYGRFGRRRLPSGLETVTNMRRERW
jgi:hypothetical protein